MDNVIKHLSAPFRPDQIHWRPGALTKTKDSAIPLAYLDARDVMQRLDDVCGSLWQNKYPFEGCCEIGIYLNDQWVWRSNGAGETNIEAEKGQYSDSFKRAGVQWGIGRYLYDVPNIWMPINQYKKFDPEVIKQLNSKLDAWQTKYFQNKEK